jgi:predicted metal-dependent hydrolase
MMVEINKLVRSKRRTIALVVESDSTLTVRAPLTMPEREILAFVASHTAWIQKNQARLRRITPPPPKQYRHGERFPLLGEDFPLVITSATRPALRFTGDHFQLSRSAIPQAREVFTRWYRQEARNILTERVNYLAARHGFHYSSLRISSARTRWGSCSSRGTLSFTWRLILAPRQVIDYVILHELVHTRVRDHSRNFWRHLAELDSGYKKHVLWLKNNGKNLNI